MPISRPDAGLDPGLARPAPDPYVYRSPFKRRVARAIDALGGLLQPASAEPIAWGQVRRVAVLRLDHLGDLLLSFPALDALRRALPQAEIDLYTGAWCAELGAWSPNVDLVHAVDAPWFQRGGAKRSALGAMLGLARRLRQGRYDLVVELRGEGRHLPAVRLSGARYRLGHAQTAGRFLLTHAGRWDAALHESEQSLNLLRQAGLPGVPPKGKARPALKLPAVAKAQAAALLRRWKLKPGFLAIHASAGSPSRLWPREHWIGFLRGLPKGKPALLLGSASEREGLQGLIDASGRQGLRNAAGETDLASLAGLLASAGRLVCLNSGPGHIAAALGTPVTALYAAANDPARWGPRGADVKVLSAVTPCAPCELADCPYDNECLRRVTPQRALAALRGR